MRLAGVSARSAVMMSFSRRIGTEPSISEAGALIGVGHHAFAEEMRSPGLSSTFSAMFVSVARDRAVAMLPAQG